ncbi:MAG: NAD(P)-dependent oxidoreductase, partial [Dermabacter sp.]|nr:NAD(P)-dependent oxidoreductase [Dermabacter sp.]
GRSAVILRLGQLYGRDPGTTYALRKTREGEAVLLGKPSDYITLVHHIDAGRAFLAALDARSGFYNVGGEPITRARWAKDLGREARAGMDAKFFPAATQAVLPAKMDVQRRSLRVSSIRFMRETGWRPTIGPSSLGWSRI